MLLITALSHRTSFFWHILVIEIGTMTLAYPRVLWHRGEEIGKKKDLENNHLLSFTDQNIGTTYI